MAVSWLGELSEEQIAVFLESGTWRRRDGESRTPAGQREMHCVMNTVYDLHRSYGESSCGSS